MWGSDCCGTVNSMEVAPLMSFRRNLAALVLTKTLLFLVLLSGCSETSQPYGYWEGKGTATEMPMNDAVRKLTRQATYEFWFTLSESGDAVGEIELKYDAELVVVGLPSVSAPAGSFGSISFKPEVGGTMTDLDPTRKFPLVGVYDEGVLVLEIATPEADRPPLEFTIRADAGISGGVSVGPVGVDDAVSGNAEIYIEKIEMTPFSPFDAGAPVEQRASGPYAVSYESKGENFSIEWSAVQRNQEQRQFELSPELELELRRLREQFSRP